MEQTRVLLVDDHVIVRRGISLFLDTEPSIEIVGEANNGREAICQAKILEPDVILIDLVMPKGNGIEAIAELKKRLPETKIIVLTTFDDKEKVKAAMRAGANGYLLKDADGQALVRAIKSVKKGGMPVHPDIIDRLIENVTQESTSNEDDEILTEREKEILELVGKGLSNRAVAKKLMISEGTVKVHVSNIFNKFGVRSRTKAVLRAIEMGLIRPD